MTTAAHLINRGFQTEYIRFSSDWITDLFPDSRFEALSLKLEVRRSTVEGTRSKLEVRSSKVEARSSKVETRSSTFEARNWKLEGIIWKVEVRRPKFETRNAAFQKSTGIWQCLGSCRVNSGQDGAKISRKRPKIMPRSAPNGHEGGPHAKITAWFETCSPNCSHIRYMFVSESRFF